LFLHKCALIVLLIVLRYTNSTTKCRNNEQQAEYSGKPATTEEADWWRTKKRKCKGQWDVGGVEEQEQNDSVYNVLLHHLEANFLFSISCSGFVSCLLFIKPLDADVAWLNCSVSHTIPNQRKRRKFAPRPLGGTTTQTTHNFTIWKTIFTQVTNTSRQSTVSMEANRRHWYSSQWFRLFPSDLFTWRLLCVFILCTENSGCIQCRYEPVYRKHQNGKRLINCRNTSRATICTNT
jgi:hypothetical protein